MLSAAQYGNNFLYLNSTARFLGISGTGKSNVSSYSATRQYYANQLTDAQRYAAPSAAIPGILGGMPVAFPLVSTWTLTTPLT
jgi:hypothetical protein